MRHLITLSILTLAATASAQEPNDLPALVVTSSGYYYLVVDDAGEPTLVEVPRVIDLDDGGTPDPPEPPDDPDDPTPPDNPLVDQIEQWAAEVDHPQGAQALAMVYQTVADNVSDGTLDVDDAFPAIKQATDQVLAEIGGADQWDGFRQKLGDYIVDRLQAGELGTQAEMASFLGDVSTGLGNSAEAAPALDPEVITAIIELILRIIGLFGDDAGDNGGPV